MSQRRLLLLSLTLGLLTALLVYAYVKASVRGEGPAETVSVVVAEQDIRPKTAVTAQMLAVKKVPANQVHRDAVRGLNEAVGRLTRDTILAGEQVLNSRLYERDEKPGLTFVIPPGKRAVSVAVNEVIGVAGFVKPGDRVDVLGTFDEQAAGKTVTTTVLQDVEVLAISQRMEDENPDARVATTATLALSLDEAEKVTLAEEEGRLRLALRPAGQQGEEYSGSATTKQLTQRSGKSLASIVPGAAPKQAASPGGSAVAASADAEPERPSWVVELFRGVERHEVEVKEE